MHTPSSTYSTPVKVVNGRAFGYSLRRADANKQTQLACDLVTGRTALADPTIRQASKLTGASPYRIKKRLKDAASGTGPREMSDAALDRLLAHVGHDRVMQAIDRYTSPQFQFAE